MRAWCYLLTKARGTGNCGVPGGRRCRYLSHAVNAEHSDIALDSVYWQTLQDFFSIWDLMGLVKSQFKNLGFHEKLIKIVLKEQQTKYNK